MKKKFLKPMKIEMEDEDPFAGSVYTQLLPDGVKFN
jgi:hypothetical protein